jgi:hypothetical protein
MRAGGVAGDVGDSCDQRRPDFGRRVDIGPVIATRMEAQRCGVVQSRDAAIAQIRLSDCARNRLRHCEQPSCGFGRSHRGQWLPPVAIRRRFQSWQVEEGSRLVEYVAQTLQPPVQGDEVEEIAMLARGGVGPFAGGALPAVRSCEANKQATARRIGDIANDPVATLATSVGEVAAAHRLGITREAARQIGGL